MKAVKKKPSFIQTDVVLRRAFEKYNDRMCIAVDKVTWRDTFPRRRQRLLLRATRLRDCEISKAIRKQTPVKYRRAGNGHEYVMACRLPECPACNYWKYTTGSLLPESLFNVSERRPIAQSVLLQHFIAPCARLGTTDIDWALTRLRQRLLQLRPALRQHFAGAYLRWEISDWRCEAPDPLGVSIHVHIVGEPRITLIRPGRRTSEEANSRLREAWAETADEGEGRDLKLSLLWAKKFQTYSSLRYLHAVKNVGGRVVPKLLAGLVAELERESGVRKRVKPGVQPEQLACIITAYNQSKTAATWVGAWNVRSRRKKRPTRN